MNDFVFSETKMNEQPIKCVEYCKVTFFDISPLVQSQKLYVVQVIAPRHDGTSIRS